MRLFHAMLWAAAPALITLHAADPVLPYPVLFVTQTPQPMDFTTVTALFGNHRGTPESAPRGGALWIRYEDGTLRNLTQAAGYGVEGAQHTNGIAVREPCVHWDGAKALFSMVVGAPKRQYDYQSYYWQIYEISHFRSNEVPVITIVPHQPADYNNVSPIYGSDDRILFTSDRPRDGQRHLYPQLDEYEEAPVVSGLWSLDPATGDLFLLNHSPSGVFSPGVDSFGRVLFSRWDHLQRDQQADADRASGGTAYGTFNYSDESASALILTNNRAEVFPEPRYAESTTNGHVFNHFFPWQINQDGTEEETLNHIGRHELGGSYRAASLSDDPNVVELYYFGNKPNTNTINNFIQLRESPTSPGLIYGIDAPEFGTHAAGQIIAIEGAPTINPDLMKLFYVTSRATASFTEDNGTPSASHTGLYRNPLPLSDGRLAAVHTPETRADRNEGSAAAPQSRYDFRLKLLKSVGGHWQSDVSLTPGLSATVSWWQPDYLISYSGPLWELDPVEVRPRSRPSPSGSHLPEPEAIVFREEGVDPAVFRHYLRLRDLALMVTRDVTGRDAGDRQQPFNLRVPGGRETVGASGRLYDVQYLQLFQADLLRGIGLRGGDPRPGRRVLAQVLHDPLADNPSVSDNPEAPPGSVRIAPDGSAAALVPARRAMSWQITDPVGTPVVRERYWITFQPGEIRSCANCHGVNRQDQAGRASASQPPEALRRLLRHWKANNLPVVATTQLGGAAYPTVTFKRQVAAERVRQRVEYSADLETWLPASSYAASGAQHNGPLEEILLQPGAFQTITLRDTAPVTALPRRFYRVVNDAP